MKAYLRFIVIALFLFTAGTMHAETTVYVVTGNTINVRATPDMNGEVVGKLHKGDHVIATDMYNSEWAEIQYYLSTRYVSRKYISYAGWSDDVWKEDIDLDFDTERITTWWTIIKDRFWWGGLLLFIVVLFPIIQKKGQNSEWKYTYMLWTVISTPFYILDMLQFWLAKPWRPLMKRNLLNDKFKKPMRIFLRIGYSAKWYSRISGIPLPTCSDQVPSGTFLCKFLQNICIYHFFVVPLQSEIENTIN